MLLAQAINGVRMKFIWLDSTDPYLNLAIEEHLFNTATDEIFMLWQNDSTVVIGKNQNAYAQVNMDYAEEMGIRIARRITGGGAVYHDLGNLNYTFISPHGRGEIDFARFCAPITEALRDLGVEAKLTGRNDLEVDGKKISGNAQHASGDRVLHHGTLLFNSDLTVLDKVLNTDKEKLRARAVDSNRARVVNLCELLPGVKSARELGEHILERIADKFDIERISVTPCQEIMDIRGRNSSPEWLYPERDLLSRYEYSNKKRYDFGTVEVYLEMKNGKILSAKIRGDFFGTHPISELENYLKGKTKAELKGPLLEEILAGTILGMTKTELAELLTVES